jgi:hypothetical protein
MDAGFKYGYARAGEIFATWLPELDREIFEKNMLAPRPVGLASIAAEKRVGLDTLLEHRRSLTKKLKMQLPVIKGFLDSGIIPTPEQVSGALKTPDLLPSH